MTEYKLSSEQMIMQISGDINRKLKELKDRVEKLEQKLANK